MEPVYTGDVVPVLTERLVAVLDDDLLSHEAWVNALLMFRSMYTVQRAKILEEFHLDRDAFK